MLLGVLDFPKTISYAKFGGQTECIMGNWKIVNMHKRYQTLIRNSLVE